VKDGNENLLQADFQNIHERVRQLYYYSEENSHE